MISFPLKARWTKHIHTHLEKKSKINWKSCLYLIYDILGGLFLLQWISMMIPLEIVTKINVHEKNILKALSPMCICMLYFYSYCLRHTSCLLHSLLFTFICTSESPSIKYSQLIPMQTLSIYYSKLQWWHYLPSAQHC